MSLGKRIGRAVGEVPMPVKIIGALLAVLLVAPMLQSAYAGGWEVTAQLSTLNVDGRRASSYAVGASNAAFDPDGNFLSAEQANAEGKQPDQYDDPAIVVEKSLVYKIRQSTSSGWVVTDDSNLVDFYDVGTEASFVRYHHWTFGVDIIIKTDADAYHKAFGAYVTYGYYYEANVVEADVWTSFSINPWAPEGEDGSYDITGGWSGVLGASVYARSEGLVEDAAVENQGHTISNLHSVNAPLNLDVTPTDFKGGEGSLANVPSSFKMQTKAKLGAGAKYTTDVFGHWDSLAVRNVFVKYQIRVDVLTVLNYELKTGHQGELDDPDEENTAYAPQNTFWMGFLDLLMGAGGWIMQLAVVIVLAIVGVIILKVVFSLRRRGN